MNCEPNEVNLSTLPAGACFELTLTRNSAIRGIVVSHSSGSTIVYTGASRMEHWSSDAPVVHFPDVNDSDWINQIKKENNEMADKKKKERKPKAVKLHRVILFGIGKSEPLEKYLDEKNTAYSALMYRAIREAKEPITFAEIWDEIKRSVANKTEGKTPKATLSVILAKMVKEGMVERTEAKKEKEAKAVAA